MENRGPDCELSNLRMNFREFANGFEFLDTFGGKVLFEISIVVKLPMFNLYFWLSLSEIITAVLPNVVKL